MLYFIEQNPGECCCYVNSVQISVCFQRTLVNSSGVAQTLLEQDISTPDGLAVDWIHKHLYWTDTGNNRIEVVSLKNLEWRRTLIKDDLDEPRAIVVDPRKGQRFVFRIFNSAILMLSLNFYALSKQCGWRYFELKVRRKQDYLSSVSGVSTVQ